jgi:SNF2 family DNA or RNA helicase
VKTAHWTFFYRFQVAPLTTLGHWQREVQTWTDMNVVLYAGNAEEKQLIRVRCAGARRSLIKPSTPS